MSAEMERLGRTIRAAESKGPTRYCNGVTVSAASGGYIDVEVPIGRRPAIIPGSFRKALAIGQSVRLSVVGDQYTIDGVLSALTTPTVAAPPSSVTYSTSGVGGLSTGPTYDQADLNSIFDEIASTLNDAVGGVAANKSAINALRTTVDAIRSALIAQGHVV